VSRLWRALGLFKGFGYILANKKLSQFPASISVAGQLSGHIDELLNLSCSVMLLVSATCWQLLLQ
jgi:hypothetical protein